MAVVIIIILLFIIGICSYFISRQVHKSLQKNNARNPGVVTAIVFVLSFALILAAIFFLVINNIRIER
jgi:predicted PurR-regulated permease PerM